MADSKKFLKADVEAAVRKVADGYLTDTQMKAAVQAIWAEIQKKAGGVALPVVFTTTVSGFITDPKTVKGLAGKLPAALTAERDARLAAKSGAPDPAAEKRSKLEGLLKETETARNAAKTLADKADENAVAADADAEAAEKAATKLEELRPGSPEAVAGRTAATEARTAATEARTAHGAVNTQFSGADGNLVAVEGIVASDGSITDAEDQVKQAQAANRAAKRPAETADDRRKVANRARTRVDNLVKDAEAKKAEADTDKTKAKEEKDQSFFVREVRPRIMSMVAVGVALVALFAAIIGGLPGWAPDRKSVV